MSKLGSDIFIKTWVLGSASPAWDQVEALLKKLAEVDSVRKALTKVSRDPAIKEWDPDLKSFGKAGVDAIYRHLRAALLQL